MKSVTSAKMIVFTVESERVTKAVRDTDFLKRILCPAVWREKQDNDPRVIRVIKTSFQTFIRTIQSFLGVFDVINTPVEQLTTKPVITTTVPPSTLPPTTTAPATTA